MSMLALKNGLKDKALEYADREVSALSGRPPAARAGGLLDRASLELELGQNEKAGRDAEEASRLRPDSLAPRLALAVSLGRRNKAEEALASLGSDKADDADRAAWLAARAVLRFGLGDDAGARTDAEAAVKSRRR
jgi:hypothetical protein